MTDAWKHDALAADLASYLRGMAKPAMVWLDMQLGPQGSMRPDVFAIDKTYTALSTRAYEVKVSRSDFLADATKGKAQGYRSVAGALTFAAPKGLLKREEVPDGCGLIERSESGWRWARKPVLNRVETLPTSVWMKLVLDGIERVHDPRGELRRERTNKWIQQQKIEKTLGQDLAILCANRDRARDLLQYEINTLKRQDEELRAGREERENAERKRLDERKQALVEEIRALGQALGIPHADRLNAWDLRAAVARARPDHDRAVLKQIAQEISVAKSRAHSGLQLLAGLAEQVLSRAEQLTPPSTDAATAATEEHA
jgi:hypothetical protein